MKRTGSIFIILLLCFMVAFSGFAQEAETEQEESETAKTQDQEKKPETPFDFGLDLGIGANTFNEMIDGELSQVTYQSVSLSPDFSIGKFGIGLDITINFRFTGGQNNDEFRIREEDWVPDDFADFLDIYLPKFKYIRWDQKGAPLYIKLGQLEGATLGNGFIVSGYSNTLFLPDRPIFGLTFDLDGRLFKFPYVGIETFVGNLADFDVMGGRLFVRPLAWLDVPIIKNLQFGGTVAYDRLPFNYAPNYDIPGVDENAASVMIIGADMRLPILSAKAISLSVFGDIVFENEYKGGMAGLGGAFFGIIPYRFEIRFLGENFIPQYFGPGYDLMRPLQYEVFEGSGTVPPYTGWMFNTGLSVMDNKVGFAISLDGPFDPPDTNPANFKNYPHLRGVVYLMEGVLPGISANFVYDKKYLGKGDETFFESLISPEGALIGATISYDTGPAKLSLVYNLKYNPALEGEDKWEITSGLQSSISLF